MAREMAPPCKRPLDQLLRGKAVKTWRRNTASRRIKGGKDGDGGSAPRARIKPRVG